MPDRAAAGRDGRGGATGELQHRAHPHGAGVAAVPELEWLYHRMPRMLVPGVGSDVGDAGGVDDEVQRWLVGAQPVVRENCGFLLQFSNRI